MYINNYKTNMFQPNFQAKLKPSKIVDELIKEEIDKNK